VELVQGSGEDRIGSDKIIYSGMGSTLEVELVRAALPRSWMFCGSESKWEARGQRVEHSS